MKLYLLQNNCTCILMYIELQAGGQIIEQCGNLCLYSLEICTL